MFSISTSPTSAHASRRHMSSSRWYGDAYPSFGYPRPVKRPYALRFANASGFQLHGSESYRPPSRSTIARPWISTSTIEQNDGDSASSSAHSSVLGIGMGSTRDIGVEVGVSERMNAGAPA